MRVIAGSEKKSRPRTLRAKNILNGLTE